MRRFMAAASALRTAPIFAQCAVAAPSFPDKLGAMDLIEAYQGAAQAVKQLDEAVSSRESSAATKGTVLTPTAELRGLHLLCCAPAKCSLLVCDRAVMYCDPSCGTYVAKVPDEISEL